MRITVTIDDELFKQASESAGPTMTKSDLIRESIKTFIRIQAAHRLSALGGTVQEPTPARRARGGARARASSKQVPLARYLDDGNMSQLELHNSILAGLPAKVVISFIDSFESVPRNQVLGALKLSESTLQRMKDTTLPPSVTEAALDLGQILRTATDLLGSREEAERWLVAPALAFKGERPLNLMATRQGVQAVFDQLVRIEYGVYG